MSKATVGVSTLSCVGYLPSCSLYIPASDTECSVPVRHTGHHRSQHKYSCHVTTQKVPQSRRTYKCNRYFLTWWRNSGAMICDEVAAPLKGLVGNYSPMFCKALEDFTGNLDSTFKVKACVFCFLSYIMTF